MASVLQKSPVAATNYRAKSGCGGLFQQLFQILPREALRAGGDLLRRAAGDELAAAGAALRAEVDDMVRDLDDVEIVLDDEHRVARVHQPLHGKVVRADGSEIFVKIGADPADPQFVINDLLPHLGREQGKKPLNEAIPSESLNILIGSWPEPDDDGPDRVKLAIMRILHEKYGIVEEDFISAELEAVPAANARDLGFDRSMIGAYGHDDRVCAYAELAAILQLEAPEKTAVCIFADKEEIGSEGVSGMQSEAFEHFMEKLCRTQNIPLTDCLAKSFCISADVTAAYDPNFAEVYEKRNASYLNYGIGLCKYTGAGGKSGASDASAEVVGRLRKLFNDNGVMWQMAELGKTDAGGGGTVAKYMAKRNIDTLDAGVPVLSMHAPYETVAKLDCYMTYKGMKVFFEQN